MQKSSKRKSSSSDQKINSIPTPTLFKSYEFDDITSPIKKLIPHIRNLAHKIAPQKRQAAEKYCKDVTLKISNEGIWVNNYDPASKTITFSKRTLEIIWICSHMYVTYFSDFVQAKQIIRLKDGSKEIIEVIETDDFEKISSVSSARELLEWVFKDWSKEQGGEWPHHLIRPISNPKTDSSENWADELMLCAVAFLLHHELAHHYLEHSGEEDGFDKIEREHEADYSSADFLLSGLQPMDRFFIKKSMAIAVALSIPIANSMNTGYWGGRSHPKCYDRLVHVLDRFIDSDHSNHITWTFAWSIINFHIRTSSLADSIKLDDQPIKSHHSLLDRYLEAFSQLEDKSQ